MLPPQQFVCRTVILAESRSVHRCQGTLKDQVPAEIVRGMDPETLTSKPYKPKPETPRPYPLNPKPPNPKSPDCFTRPILSEALRWFRGAQRAMVQSSEGDWDPFELMGGV